MPGASPLLRLPVPVPARTVAEPEAALVDRLSSGRHAASCRLLAPVACPCRLTAAERHHVAVGEALDELPHWTTGWAL